MEVTLVDLMPGERVLWTGRPVRSTLFVSHDGILIPVSLVFLAILVTPCIAPYLGSGPHPVSVYTAVAGLFLIAGLWVVFGRFVLRAIDWRRRRYILTSQRIITIHGLTGQRTEAELKGLERPVVKERPDGTGNLAFGYFLGLNDPLPEPTWVRFRPTEVETSWRPILRNIEDVRRVRDLVAEAQAAARTT